MPASPVGWLLLLAALGFAVYMFIRIDKVSHSVSDTLINFVAVLVLVFAVYMMVALLLQWIDSRTQG